jgi:hypothetical protein
MRSLMIGVFMLAASAAAAQTTLQPDVIVATGGARVTVTAAMR